MKKLSRSVTSILLIVLLFIQISTIYSIATTQSINDADGNVESITELLVNELNRMVQDKETKGAIVSIVKGDEVVLSKGFGFADEENGILADPETTAFRIGSVSKTFLAMATMQLVEEGKLDLSVPISEYIDTDFLKLKYPVTMKQLLTHTAGFEERSSGLFISDEEVAKPLKDILEQYMPTQVFQPGEVAAYSNYGITLAGYVVECITEQSYFDYTQKYIFDPLEMQNSSFKQFFSPAAVVSKGYGVDGKERKEGIVNIYPAGSLTTTAQDMGKYMQFLLQRDSRILGDDSLAEIFTRQFTSDDCFQGIGLTWGRYSRNGHMIYSHEGGTDNFSSLIFLCPDQELGVFISCNTMNDMPPMMVQIIDLLYGQQENPQSVDTPINLDLKGNYVSVIGSFINHEKIYNLFAAPIIHITGNQEQGFSYNGKKFETLDGGLLFHPDLGTIKFEEKYDRFYLMTEEVFTLTRVPWFESMNWQIFIFLFFSIASVFGVLIAFWMALKGLKNRNKKSYYFLPMIIMGVSWIYFIARVIAFLSNPEFSQADEFFNFMSLLAYICTGLGIMCLGSIVLFWIKRQSLFIKIYYTFWGLSFALLVTWFNQLNLYTIS